MSISKEEMIERICDHIRSMEDGTESIFVKAAAEACPGIEKDTEMDLFDIYHEVIDRIGEEVYLDSGENAYSITGMPYSIPFTVRKKAVK